MTLFFINKCKDEKQRKFLSILFLIIFLLHILIVIFIFYANFQPFSGGDYSLYQQQAQKISGRIHQGNFSLQGTNISLAYPVIVGYIYAVTIPSMLLGQLFNAWLVALLIIFIYLIVREIGGTEEDGFLTGLIASIYPSLAFYGSLLLKDALEVLLCMIALLLIMKIIKKFSWPKFFILYITLLGATNLRFYLAYALVLSFIMCYFIFSNLEIKKRLIYGVLVIILIGFLPIISGGEGSGQQYYGINSVKQYLTPQKITYYREIVYATKNEIKALQTSRSQLVKDNSPAGVNGTASGSSVTIKTGFESPFIFVRNTLWSFVSALFGPFPWQIKKSQQLFVLPEVIAWYVLLFFIIKGVVISLKARYKVIIPLVLFSFFVFGVLAVFINNFGIITRIRMPAILSLLCLFPFGLKEDNVIYKYLNKIMYGKIFS